MSQVMSNVAFELIIGVLLDVKCFGTSACWRLDQEMQSLQVFVEEDECKCDQNCQEVRRFL
jgi:hypothetical protein